MAPLPEIVIPQEVISLLPEHLLTKEEFQSMSLEEWEKFEGIIGGHVPYGCILRLRRGFKARNDILKTMEDFEALNEETSESILRGITDGAIVKLFDGAACVGTFVFITKDTGVCAHHSVYSETSGTLESSLRIEGKPVKLVMFFPKFDLAIYKVHGRDGAFFALAKNSTIYEGNHIALVSFPSLDSQGQDDQDEDTVFTYGRISRKSVFEQPLMILGQYPSFPNSSGGAVVSKTGRLVGIHLDCVYHENHTHYTPVRAASFVRDVAITDLKWTGLKSVPNKLATEPLETVAAFAAENVPHKQSLGVFVPVNVLRMKLQECGIISSQIGKRPRLF